LNRQAERYALEGAPMALSTMADAVGSVCASLDPPATPGSGNANATVCNNNPGVGHIKPEGDFAPACPWLAAPSAKPF
jgi:hypothetical protein